MVSPPLFLVKSFILISTKHYLKFNFNFFVAAEHRRFICFITLRFDKLKKSYVGYLFFCIQKDKFSGSEPNLACTTGVSKLCVISYNFQKCRACSFCMIYLFPRSLIENTSEFLSRQLLDRTFHFVLSIDELQSSPERSIHGFGGYKIEESSVVWIVRGRAYLKFRK